MPLPNTTCDIYGDNRPFRENSTITLIVEGETRILRVCEEHQTFFETYDPDMWYVGLSFTREVEIRPKGAHPTSPEPEGE